MRTKLHVLNFMGNCLVAANALSGWEKFALL